MGKKGNRTSAIWEHFELAEGTLGNGSLHSHLKGFHKEGAKEVEDKAKKVAEDKLPVKGLFNETFRSTKMIYSARRSAAGAGCFDEVELDLLHAAARPRHQGRPQPGPREALLEGQVRHRDQEEAVGPYREGCDRAEGLRRGDGPPQLLLCLRV
jgi:hypothetical protein